MKKLLLLKMMLLLCALVAGSGTMWAADVETTYTFSSKSWAASPANWTGTKDGNQFNSSGTPKGVQVCTGQSGVVVTSPKSFTKVKQVVVTYSSSSKGVGSIEVKVGSTSLGSQSISKSQTEKTLTYSASNLDGSVSITCTCTTNSLGINSVKIVEAGKADATLSFTSTTPSVTLSKSGSTFDTEYSQAVTVAPAAYDGTITYAFDEENSTFNLDDAMIDYETGDIEISAAANLATAKTIVVKASGTATANYNAPSDATYTLTVNPAPDGVGDPDFSLDTGSYYYGTTFTITSANSDKIYYTTDGTTPSKTNGTLYAGAIAIHATMTVKAIGYDSEDASEVSSITYTLKAPETPTFSVAEGGVAEGTTVTLTMGDGGTKVVYTTDGSTPTASSTTYSSAITINAPTTIKAATVDAGDNLSSIETRAYTIVVLKEATLWSEDFSGYSANNVPSGGTYSYSCTNGGSTTKVYNESLAGGEAPELLVSKSSGSFAATIPLDNVSGNLTLTYKANNNNLGVTASSTATGASAGAVSYDSEAKTATVTISGVTKSMTALTITFTNSASGNTRLDNILLKYNKQFETVPVTITAAEYATYCNSTNDLDFTGKATVYTVTDMGTYAKLNEIASGQVPANTPVLLHKTGGGTVNVPVITSADAVGANDLHVSTGEKPSDAYVLAKPAGYEIGFYLWDSSKTLNEGKIYLKATGAGARSFLSFNAEGETTGIESIDNGQLIMDNGAVYDLQGRKVQNPKRGLYIINGHKVVIK